MGLIHMAAILSQETEKALFYHPRPRSEKLGGEARQEKQSSFSLSGQNDRRVTKAHWVIVYSKKDYVHKKRIVMI